MTAVRKKKALPTAKVAAAWFSSPGPAERTRSRGKRCSNSTGYCINKH